MMRLPAIGGRRPSEAAAPGRRLLPALLALGLLLAASQDAAAQGAPGQDPDWPCVQRKVPHLSPAAMWPGLPDEALGADWRSDPEVAALVAEIAPRRVTMEEAEAAIRAFAAGLGDDKEDKLELLFVGLFQTLDAERDEVMRGIGRFAGKQRRLAERILADRAALAELRRQSPPDPQAIAERRQQVTWSIRVFEDRRASLGHVCDVPRIVEQRLFAFARTIRGELG
jgi:hypothetical protein